MKMAVARAFACASAVEANGGDEQRSCPPLQFMGLNPDPFLRRVSGQSFYNTSALDLRKLLGDQDHISPNFYA